MVNGCAAPRRRSCDLLAAVICVAAVSPAQVTTAWHKARLLAPGQCSMAFDSARQRVVMFTGNSTWEWDGSSWAHLSPPNSPSPRSGEAMVYDVARRRVVLFGGSIVNAANPSGITVAETWEWDGDDWVQLSPAVSPSARYLHAMAYDTVRQRVVLYGGDVGGSFGQQILGDTWEWDGVTWTPRSPVASPGLLHAHAMVYDAARQRVVLHGGESFLYGWTSNMTFEWDGVDWSQRGFGPARHYHALAYDVVRQRVVLFGGMFRWGSSLPLFDATVSDETWEWNGSVWTQQTPAVHPGPAVGHAMAYDGASNSVLLFAGEPWGWDGSSWTQRSAAASPIAQGVSHDSRRQLVVSFGVGTWEWDGRVWSRRNPSTSPVDRVGHGLVFDPVRQRTLLFGGAYFADTWEWDGSTWLQHAPAAAPGARAWHAMAADPVRQRVVLFGGEGPSYTQLADTWEWDGSTWMQVATPAAPSARRGHAMAFDPVRQRVLLFGGAIPANPSPVYFSDGWEWDGVTWAQTTPAASPVARAHHAMAADGLRQRVLLYGGNDWNGAFSDTWVWDGVNWTMWTQPAVGPVVYSGSATFDAARGEIVMLGSGHGGGDPETWRFGAHVPATIQVVGAGCAGSQGQPVLTSSEPYLGHPSFRLELLDAAANAACLFGIAWSGASVPLGGGCVLHLGSPAQTWFAVSNAAGFAQGPRFPIPHDPALWGLTLHAQAGVLDNQAPLGFALSAGRVLVVGD
jgi:hypothetical protein